MASLTLFSCDAPLDIELPEIEIISPKEGVTYYAAIPIELRVTDISTVDRVEVFLDNQLVKIFTEEPFVAKLDISGFEEKPRMVRAVAYARGGNTAESQLSIFHSHGLKILSPNGTEVWPEGSTQTVTWERCGVAADYVSLYYSLNRGASWTQIIASTPNNGLYHWTLPDISESQASGRVMVSCVDGNHSDISDDDFAISQWSPVLAGSCKVSGYPIGIFVSEDYAYMTDGYRGLEIINILDPINPVLLGTYVTPGDRTWSAFVRGSYAFVADGFPGLHVIDVSNPTSPTLLGSFDTPGYAYRVLVSENHAYVADGDAGLRIIDVSYPANPKLAGFYDTPGMAFCLFKAGSYTYIADGNAGLQIINVSDPASPVSVGFYDTPGSAHGVFISGLYAYVADMEVGLQIVDISNPANPTLAGVHDTPGTAQGVFVSGNYAYVADMSFGLQVINVSNPVSPILVGSTDRSVSAMDVSASGDYAYVTDHNGRLVIYDVSGHP
jgi:hypothetical protein